MERRIIKRDNVSVCNESGCIHAYGKYAKIIAAAAVAMLLLIGLGALLKAIK